MRRVDLQRAVTPAVSSAALALNACGGGGGGSSDDCAHALGNPAEGLRAVALFRRETGTCSPSARPVDQGR